MGGVGFSAVVVLEAAPLEALLGATEGGPCESTLLNITAGGSTAGLRKEVGTTVAWYVPLHVPSERTVAGCVREEFHESNKGPRTLRRSLCVSLAGSVGVD